MGRRVISIDCRYRNVMNKIIVIETFFVYDFILIFIDSFIMYDKLII